jgi:hypothetical protein
MKTRTFITLFVAMILLVGTSQSNGALAATNANNREEAPII